MDQDSRLGAARTLRLSPAGRFTTVYQGHHFSESYIDSGTGTYILADDRLPLCRSPNWAFCVSPSRQLDATLVGQGGSEIHTYLRVGDYSAALSSGYGADDSLAVLARSGSNAFVWGAPFFLGRRVFLVLDGKAIPGSDILGPFYALLP